ncbi:MAG: InlB B-repeat-containing protein [Anaerotardibacter sp.]
MKKRFLSVLLALCLSLALVPAMAFAEGTIPNTGTLSDENAVYDYKVKNSIPGKISGGTFNNTVENNDSGIISGGTFYGKVKNSYGGYIKDGTFNDTVENSAESTIAGGTFNSAVTNKATGIISGGTFYGKVENKDIATIEGGVFYGGISGSYSFPPKTTCYSVEFNLNGGVGDIPTQYFVDTTSGVALEPQTNPTRDGYDFTGWYADEACKNPYNFESPVTSTFTLYAGWEKEQSISVSANYTTTVEQLGNVAPGETTFNLRVINSTGDKVNPGNVNISASVTTYGKGDYLSTITFTGILTELKQLFDENSRVYVQQVDEGLPNWEYDNTVWCLQLYDIGNDGPAYLSIFPTKYEESDNGKFYYVEDAAYSVNQMTFNNKYTENAGGASEDGTNPASTDTNKDTQSTEKTLPQTGDNTFVLVGALILASVVGLIGAGVFARANRKKGLHAK